MSANGYDVETIRRDFPILSREVYGKPLVYLDNGASAQKPQAVIDAVTKAYSSEYAWVIASITTCGFCAEAPLSR